MTFLLLELFAVKMYETGAINKLQVPTIRKTNFYMKILQRKTMPSVSFCKKITNFFICYWKTKHPPYSDFI